MTPAPKHPESGTDRPGKKDAELLAKRYKLAWQAAVESGDAPNPETFLAGLQGSDRQDLQIQLQEIDQSYRGRLETGSMNVDTTIAPPGAADGGLNSTIETAEMTPLRLDATIDQSEADANQTDFAIGSLAQFPGYQILGELGRGGMGVVYKARQKGLNRLVALKMLLAGAHADLDQVVRFNTEAEAVARLQHPNIVQIYEVGQHDGLPFFSLEFVDGCGLNQKLGGKPQPFREAAELIMILARAMHYAHEHGVVHRDLKPGNVLLTSTGVPKIADFGLAKQLECDSSQTKSGTLMGTPSYMAPEQARGDVHAIGPATDTYSLGAIFYELLTGRAPFVAAGVMDTVMRVIKEEPVRPSLLREKLPADLETICLKCLQKEPHQRYSSAGALADDLDRFLAGEAILARPVPSWERLARWCRRNPRVAALTATTFVLLVAGMIGSAGAAITIAKERNNKELERQAAVEARVLAEQRKQEADQAKEEAQKNAKLAMDQSNLALKAFHTLVGQVQQQIGDEPRMQPLKLKLLESARQGLDNVAKSDEDSRLLGQTTAGAYMQLGDVFRQMGQTEKAYAQYEKCFQITQALLAKDPDGDVALSNVAASHTAMGGIILEWRRDIKASMDHYQKALEINRKLYGRPLQDEKKLSRGKIKRDLAESYTRVGVTYLRLGEPTKARVSFQEALTHRKELVAANSSDGPLKLDLGRSHMALGEIDFRERKWTPAREQFQNALLLSEQIARQYATSPTAKRELANTLGNFGVFELRTGDLAGADKHLGKCLTLMKELADADQANALNQRYLGLSQYRMATLARKRNEPKTAELLNQACLKIREGLAPANESRQIDLLLVLPRCGQHARAAELAAKIQNGGKADREVLVDLAQCLAQCAAATANEQTVQQRYVNQAMTVLHEAAAKGFTDATLLETEPDFDALQQIPDFQALIKRLKQGGTAG